MSHLILGPLDFFAMTPGRDGWGDVEPTEYEPAQVHPVDAEDQPIAYLNDGARGEDVADAYAQLFAAAPDLYLMGDPTMKTAREIAIAAHEGQTRKYLDDPYIVHPLRVAGLAARFGLPPAAVDGGWLHDVVEDTAWTYDMLRAQGISAQTVGLVLLLTKWWKGADAPFSPFTGMYYGAILLDPLAIDLKLLDRADNFGDMIRVIPGHRGWAVSYLKKSDTEMAPLLRASTRPAVVAYYQEMASAVARALEATA